MKTAHALAALGLALLLGVPASPLLAQTADAEPQTQEPQAQADATDNGAPMPEDALNPDAQDIAQVGDDPDASPGRFIPTEQLSQDLGASFPVDI